MMRKTVLRIIWFTMLLIVFTCSVTNTHSQAATKKEIRFTYERDEAIYDGWNLWVWDTDDHHGQVDFHTFQDRKAIATISLGGEANNVGFIVRHGTDWGDAKKDIGHDRFIRVNERDRLTKVFVKSGEAVFHVVPEVREPLIGAGAVTFFYRDPNLYDRDEMDTIDGVTLSIDGRQVPMTYETENEWFTVTVDQLDPGTYPYTFLVESGGVEREVNDPYHTVDGVSQVTYEEVITGEFAPQMVTYNENAVLTIESHLDEDVAWETISVDLRALGGKEETFIDPELQAVTVNVRKDTAAGEKLLPITAIDVDGNRYTGSATLIVSPRTFAGKGDFDWDEAVIYFMLTDRFFDGNRANNDPYGIGYDPRHHNAYQGGDFKGVTKKLDYLQDLGINTIWLTPIVENIRFNVRHQEADGDTIPDYGYHGYWAINFEKLNPHLGTMAEFHELIDEANERGIKIMADVVLNHTGYGLREVDALPESSRPFGYPTDDERARFSTLLRQGHHVGDDMVRGELAGLPDFKTEEAHVREQIVKWQTDWIERSTTAKGNTIDYFRVDTVKHVEPTTWMHFKNELTKQKPDFKLIGEAWGASVHDDYDYLQSGMMDALLDFDFKRYARDFVGGSVESVNALLEWRNEQLTNDATLGQFLGSHDEDTFLTQVGGDKSKLKLAAALQITAKGQPVIYYGEEIGMGGRANYPYNENRYVFPWEKVAGNDMHAHYRALLQARSTYPQVFAKGDRAYVAGSDREAFLAFTRTYEDTSILVALNVGDHEKTHTFTGFKAHEAIVDLYSGTTYEATANGELTVALPSRHDGGTMLLVSK